MSIYCGTGKVEITPELGTQLAGYGGGERKASSVHDSLHARIIVVSNDKDYFVIISLDLVGVDRQYTETLTRKINNRFKVPHHNVFVHATHTHSAPGGIFDDKSLIVEAYPYMNGFVSYKDDIVTYQHKQICKGIETALSKLEPCELKYGEGFGEGIGTNRNSPEQPYDSKLRVIEFRYFSGDKAVLYHFACHPTIMHASNTSISADFPGETSKELEDQDDIRLALFLNGPSADISTRFTRRESTFNEVERLGQRLSDAVLHVLDDTEAIKDKPFKTKVSKIQLSTRKTPGRSTLQHQLDDLKATYSQLQTDESTSQAELRQLQSRIEGITSLVGVGDNLDGLEKVETTIQIVCIGGVNLLAIPGECYFESGQEITEKFGEPVLIAGNTNDHLGYIVPESYYTREHYESYMTLLENDSDESIKNIAIEELQVMLNAD